MTDTNPQFGRGLIGHFSWRVPNINFSFLTALPVFYTPDFMAMVIGVRVDFRRRRDRL
jgi:hypothetical protein